MSDTVSLGWLWELPIVGDTFDSEQASTRLFGQRATANRTMSRTAFGLTCIVSLGMLLILGPRAVIPTMVGALPGCVMSAWIWNRYVPTTKLVPGRAVLYALFAALVCAYVQFSFPRRVQPLATVLGLVLGPAYAIGHQNGQRRKSGEDHLGLNPTQEKVPSL